jgi:hypothetical protein
VAIPDPVSFEPAAVRCRDATLCHADDPPLTTGSVGSARSIMTGAVTHDDALPATS